MERWRGTIPDAALLGETLLRDCAALEEMSSELSVNLRGGTWRFADVVVVAGLRWGFFIFEF